jgi:hypothetical protein
MGKTLFMGTKEFFPVQYEEWGVECSALPARSELYCVRPVNLNTSFTESLASYIARLAERHCISTRDLVVKKLLPFLGRPYLSDLQSHDNITAFWKDTSTLNGANKLTSEWVRLTEGLTLYPNLHLLTMLSWANVISPKGLIRRSNAWCSYCYEELKRDKQDVYNPLIWSLEVVSICPQHSTMLQSQCPYDDCGQSMPMLSPRFRPGYCSHCGRWLGCQYASEGISVSTHLQDENLLWQRWVAASVGELIASAPNLKVVTQKERFAEAVATYLEEVAGGNVSAAARKFRVARRTVRDWKKGVQIPQLASILQFCYLCNLSPLHLLTEDISAAEFSGANRTPSGRPIGTAKKHHRSFDSQRLRHALEEVLQSDEYPPPPMSKVAKRLRYDHSFLIKHFPDLCSAISARFEEYRTKRCEEKKRQAVCEVRQTTQVIHAQGVYPSQVRVRNSLAIPGSMRMPEALNAWHATLKELGWEK